MKIVYALPLGLVLLVACVARGQDLSLEDLTQQVEAETERVRDDRVEPEDREAAVLGRVEALRQLVLGFPETEAFPEHLAAWAEAVLYERLGALESLAVVSHEFGVPSDRQRVAIEGTLGELIEQLRSFDVMDERVDEPLRWRLLLSLATAEHARAFAAPSEAEALRSGALEAIARIVEEIGLRPVPAAVKVLEARVRLAMGEVSTARGIVEPLLEGESVPMDGTYRLARLVLAECLRREGEHEAANSIIDRFGVRLVNEADAAWRLVLADWRWRGEVDLEVYRPLTQGGPGVVWIRAVLAERWLDTYLNATEQEVAGLPLWMRTQLLYSAWDRLPVHPVEALAFAPASSLSDMDRARLGWVGDLADSLAQMPDLLADARRSAERIAVLARFAASGRSARDAVEASESLMTLAGRMRRETEALVVVRQAADLLWPHQTAFVAQDEDPVTPVLLDALGRVFEGAPRELADTPNHVLMAAYYIDRVGVDAEEAIAFYRRVPLEALGYWQAQPLLLVELRRGARETLDPPVRRQFRRDLLLAMARIDAEGARLLRQEGVSIAQRDGARTALFRVRLLRAELAVEAGELGAGQQWLESALEIDSRPRARLEVEVARARFLMLQGDHAAMLDRLERLPAREGAVRRLAIDLMSALSTEMTAVSLLELDPPDQSEALPETDPEVLAFVERLTMRSVAAIDPDDPDPSARAELYQSQLLRAHALLLQGDADGAAQLVGELVDGEFATPEVLELAVVANLRLGTREGLVTASLMADRVIQGYESPPFPDRWWRCWLRRLLILERLRVGVPQVAPQVRRLERINPNLGGPELKARFLELAERCSAAVTATQP